MGAAALPVSFPRRAAWSLAVAADSLLWQPRFPFRSREQIARAQQRRLRSAIVHAYQHVPYYRETMRRGGLSPSDFGTARDLARLPLLERDHVQRDPEYFVSTAAPVESYLRLGSGGTTGRPLTVYRDPRTVMRRVAHRQRAHSVTRRIAGRPLRLRHALILPPSSSTGDGRRAFRQLTTIPSGVRATYLELSLLDSPRENVARLNEFSPHVISTYGSYLEALFFHLVESGQPFHRPQVVTYGSDVLSDRGRQLIEDTFGIPVLSAYHAVEAPPIGFECESHCGLHVNVDLCPLRLVDSDGRDVGQGDGGEVVISNLVNRGTMLLNYRLGDLVCWLPGKCACGRNLPLISFLEGRSEAWLATASGEAMHPQAVRMLLRTEREIWRYQVVQLAPTRFEINVVVDPAADQIALDRRLTAKFAGLFGADTEVRVEFQRSLPTTGSGKVKPVIGAHPTRR